MLVLVMRLVNLVRNHFFTKTDGIDYITIASEGNAQDLQLRNSNSKFCGKHHQLVYFYIYPTVINTIQFVTIATLGDTRF